MKILVVDDEKEILEILGMALETIGDYQVSTCTSGEQALALIEAATEPFDFIFLDIQMPKMTGIELCDAIRKLPQYRFTPITMLTAMTEKDYFDRAFAAGATDYLPKPFDYSELKHRMAVAEKAAFQARSLSENAQTIKGMAEASDAAHPHKISEALPINDVPGVIRTYAFENYLMQMGRFQFQRSNLYVVSITNIQDIYQKCTGRSFYDMILDISEGISAALVGSGALISYYGCGLFAIVMERSHAREAEQMKSDIADVLFQMGVVFQSGEPLALDLEIASIPTPSLLSPTNTSQFVDALVSELKRAAHFFESEGAGG